MDSNHEDINHDLIDSLLDEFNESSSPKQTSHNETVQNTEPFHVNIPPGATLPSVPDADSLNSLFEKLLQSMPDEEYRKQPENLQQSLEEAARMINPQPARGSDAREIEEDELIQKLMAEFQLGSDANLEETVEKLMSQMLSADTLKEPVKQVAAKYPIWLAEHGSRLSDEERRNYENQHAVFKRMCLLFDNGEAGADTIMNMMTEIQSFGQPPKEILQELVPGLDFSNDGEPILKDLPPEFANLGADQANCSLM